MASIARALRRIKGDLESLLSASFIEQVCREAVTCSPKLDPVVMRVLTARMGKEILDEAEATRSGPDHRQAA